MTDTEQVAEISRLQARVAELEAELADQQRRTNALVAEAQTKLEWLERWHVDLNALMQRRGMEELRQLVRAVRSVFRRVRNTKRRYLD